MPSPDRLVLASRQSALALRQTEVVAAALTERCGIAVDILPLSTRGDEITDRPLAEVGGKALFIKGLQEAIREGRADAAVHSLKDMEAAPTPGFTLAAVGFAAARHDVLVCRDAATPHDLPADAMVGTCSPRRTALLRRHHPTWRTATVRGNLQTRLKKLQAGEYDALMLAAAGLQRLEMTDLAITPLPMETFIPAVGQGLLGIECAADNAEVAAVLAQLDDPILRQCATAERAFAAAMQGDCHTALGAHATVQKDGVAIHAFYADDDGRFYDVRTCDNLALAAGEAAAGNILQLKHR